MAPILPGRLDHRECPKIRAGSIGRGRASAIAGLLTLALLVSGCTSQDTSAPPVADPTSSSGPAAPSGSTGSTDSASDAGVTLPSADDPEITRLVPGKVARAFEDHGGRAAVAEAIAWLLETQATTWASDLLVYTRDFDAKAAFASVEPAFGVTIDPLVRRDLFQYGQLLPRAKKLEGRPIDSLTATQRELAERFNTVQNRLRGVFLLGYGTAPGSLAVNPATGSAVEGFRWDRPKLSTTESSFGVPQLTISITTYSTFNSNDNDDDFVVTRIGTFSMTPGASTAGSNWTIQSAEDMSWGIKPVTG